MMTVRAQWEPGTDSYAIWFLLPDALARSSIGSFTEDGKLVWTTYENDGRVLPPTLRLPSMIVSGLRDALNGNEFGPEGGSAGHLRDAVKVRDRLLTIIEGQLPAKGSR